FGHQTKRWNPKMKKYIFGDRNGIYILDLEQTLSLLNQACDFLRDTAAKGAGILFVGTKKQAQDIVRAEAERCGAYYVNQRWLGGTLTNFQTIRRSVKRFEEIEKMKEDGTFHLLKKKEVAVIMKEHDKLKRNLGGIIKMNKLPSCLFVIDPKNEEIAVLEANRLGIPIVGLIDTNCDPDLMTYPIAGNDDAIRSIKLITATVSDNILEGRQKNIETIQAQEAALEKGEGPEKKMDDIEVEERLIDEKLQKKAAVPGVLNIKKKKPVSRVKK
ncbi:MAG: 30S ribosomal protein S2, partial [Candidatus Omnitrophica bacterium]|nr:30S ribosomal protein S2 [Candidatus Omnitrophota bacterium]